MDLSKKSDNTVVFVYYMYEYVDMQNLTLFRQNEDRYLLWSNLMDNLIQKSSYQVNIDFCRIRSKSRCQQMVTQHLDQILYQIQPESCIKKVMDLECSMLTNCFKSSRLAIRY